MGQVLIVYHSLTGNTEAAAKAVAAGAAEITGTEVVLKEALKGSAEDLLQCDAVAFGSLDAFSYMAGGLKDFFDRTYYPTEGQVVGKPYVAFLTHGGGGRAITSIESICDTFKLSKVAEPVLVQGRPDATAEVRLKELGAALAKAAANGTSS